MRTLVLVLLFANLLVFAGQFDVIRGLVGITTPPARQAQMNAERLRIVRDTSARVAPSAEAGADGPRDPSPAGDAPRQPPSGTNNR